MGEANNKITILLDTNILLYIYDGMDPETKILSFLLIKPIFLIHESVLEELELLSHRHPNYKKRIDFALRYISLKGWNIIGGPKHSDTDSTLLAVAKDKGFWIFTNDKELIRKCKNEGVSVIYLTGKGKIIKSTLDI